MKWFFKILGGIILFGALAFLLGWVVMWLWNWLVPELFAGPVITYWQAWGLLILSKLLFSSWSKGGGHHHHGPGPGGWKGKQNGYWKKRWERKLAGMTPEQREVYIKRMRERCGWSWDYEEQPKTDEQNPQN